MNRNIPNEIENKKIKSIEDFDNSAEKIYRNSSQIPDDPGHGKYLKKKGLRSEEIPGLRFGYYHQYPSLVVPIRDINGVIRSIQYIYEDYEGKTQKRFLKDAEKQNCFLSMSDLSASETIFVTEGIATAASLKKILAVSEKYSSYGVVCSFSAQSMAETARHMTEAFEYSEVIAAPDADEAGDKAAIECKKLGIYSIFPPKKKKGIDWNDIYQELGTEKALEEFEAALSLKNVLEQPIPEIQKILDQIEEDPCREFYMESFPPILRDYIESLCETTEAHPIMITMSVLCSISSMVGKKVYIPKNRGEDGYFQDLYPNIWSLCITKSGGFKTTALNKGAEIALEEDRRILRLIKDIEDQDPNYNPLDDKSKLDAELQAEILRESLKRPILPTRVTAEFLIKYLAQGHHGMILSSEMGEWLGNMQKNHNVDLKQIFTYFYDVDIAPYERRTNHCGGGIVQRPFITINSVSTVEWVQKHVKADDVFSGFFARMLLFAPPFEDKIPDALPQKKVQDPKALDAKRKIIETLWNLGDITFSLSAAARMQFQSVHTSLYLMVRQSKYDERCQSFLEPYLKRWSPYVLKLAMLFNILEDPTSEVISERSIKAATEIIKLAIKSTAKLFEKELGESEDQSKQRKVYGWVSNRCTKNKKAPFYSLIASRLLDGGSKEYEEVVQTLIDSQKIRCFNQSEGKKNWLLEV